MRKFKPFREFYIRKDYREVHRDDALGILVLGSADGVLMMGFSGRRQKPDFHFDFRSAERAQEYITKWLGDLQERAACKIAARERRCAFRRT